jgi:hypothetical protein
MEWLSLLLTSSLAETLESIATAKGLMAWVLSTLDFMASPFGELCGFLAVSGVPQPSPELRGLLVRAAG